MKKYKIFTAVSVTAFLVGLVMVVYPYISEYFSNRAHSEIIVDYDSVTQSMENSRYQALFAEAHEYNKRLFETGIPGDDYDSQLNVTGTGMMGYVEIPKINCYLPVRHSTDEKVMQNSVGHLKRSSLPVGGNNTHSILSAHRGELSSRLFTDLDKLECGDIFIIKVLGEELYYEIYSIITVLPEEVSYLSIEKDKDLCTLITCTPFGINTHRLLVRGQRTEKIEN